MNPRRILFALAAVMALAVSAGVCVVALAFALYALVKPYVGQAGASAVVAGAAALLIAIIALVLANIGKPRKKKPTEPQTLVDRAMGFLREKPVLAIAAGLAAGLLAVRNPRYLGEAIRAFVEGRNPPAR